MGIKRSITKSNEDSNSSAQAGKANKKAKNASEPLDPSLPNNTQFPEAFKFTKQEGSLTIASYNVASLRACLQKGFKRYVDAEDADILCVQETKVNTPVATAVDDKVYKYRYWSHEEKKGYGGTAVFSKFKPESVTYGLPGYEDKSRGRVIVLTFPAFTLIACYVPNAGDKLVRLPDRQVFNGHMEKYIRSLQKEGKSVVWTGSAGFTIEERTDFSKVLDRSEEENQPGLIDTWRHFHPDTRGHYTYYSFRMKCREKLLGWRLDYFVVTPDLLDKVVASEMRHEAWGASDHIPIVLTLKDIHLDE
ncbi:hypothetical protein EC973_008262 [Apophysomyces ossiformis]|uniref:Endonuclease/exonuclease/phosphatase domain-containing protein n=1 Tax=Apophysomyces ossiformis TaxID=679940 RepID=A0A8H7BV43_9FUNG|nr:hypothetical protein EC973_008262 [Apophysomyces ossiformis]